MKKPTWKDMREDQRISLKEKTRLLSKRKIISVETSPSTKKLHALNRLVRELFQ